MMDWSSQMESATLSSFIRAFWHWFHGRVTSNREARTLWRHLKMMPKVVIGRYFSVHTAPAFLAISTVYLWWREAGR